MQISLPSAVSWRRSDGCHLRFAERIVFLVADGNFSNAVSLITLSDNSNNEVFVRALMRILVRSRCETAAEMLQLNMEEDEDVEKAE